MRLKKVINIFGGPGAGKSVLAAELWVHMKKSGYIVELITEYAKMLTYEERHNILIEDQLYVFAKQHRKIFRVKNFVDYVIVDSPLIQGITYFDHNGEVYDWSSFKAFVETTFESYPNFNLFLERNPSWEYQQDGRFQGKEGAKQIDRNIKLLLMEQKIPHNLITAGNIEMKHILEMMI